MMWFRWDRIALALECLSVVQMVSLIPAQVITAPPAPQTSSTPGLSPYDCDNVGSFFCPTASGTCYTGVNGFVGCCSVSSCAARTTCIPYAENVMATCNVDIGGCILCSSALPSCVTISNVVNNQFIMYCDSYSTFQSASYINLVTTGSTALLPMQISISLAGGSLFLVTDTDTVSITSTATPTAASSPTAVTTIAAAVSDGVAAGIIGNSKGAMVGIIVGSVVGLVSLSCIVFILIKRRGKLRHKMIQYDQNPSTFRMPSSSMLCSDVPSSTTQGSKLEELLRLMGRPVIMTADANYPDKCLFPIARDFLARQVEDEGVARVQELDGSEPPPSAEHSHDHNGSTKNGGLAPLAKCPNTEANSSDRSSVINAPGGYKAHQSNDNLGSRVLELSSIRYLKPSGSHPSSSPESQYSCNQEALPAKSHSISPNPSTYAPTPLVDGVSPLIDNDRAFVDNTSATVGGPINWFSPMHIQPRSNGLQPGEVSRPLTLTSATGSGAKYVSPETALEEGM